MALDFFSFCCFVFTGNETSKEAERNEPVQTFPVEVSLTGSKGEIISFRAAYRAGAKLCKLLGADGSRKYESDFMQGRFVNKFVVFLKLLTEEKQINSTKNNIIISTDFVEFGWYLALLNSITWGWMFIVVVLPSVDHEKQNTVIPAYMAEVNSLIVVP